MYQCCIPLLHYFVWRPWSTLVCKPPLHFLLSNDEGLRQVPIHSLFASCSTRNTRYHTKSLMDCGHILSVWQIHTRGPGPKDSLETNCQSFGTKVCWCSVSGKLRSFSLRGPKFTWFHCQILERLDAGSKRRTPRRCTGTVPPSNWPRSTPGAGQFGCARRAQAG